MCDDYLFMEGCLYSPLDCEFFEGRSYMAIPVSPQGLREHVQEQQYKTEVKTVGSGINQT